MAPGAAFGLLGRGKVSGGNPGLGEAGKVGPGFTDGEGRVGFVGVGTGRDVLLLRVSIEVSQSVDDFLRVGSDEDLERLNRS
jgi:hypothetical protein